MDVLNTDANAENYVLCEGNFSKTYSIVVDEGCNVQNDRSFICAKNRREVELLLLILGEEASVVMDEKARRIHPEIWDWLYGKSYADIKNDLKWTYKEENEVLSIIEKIPMPKASEENNIQSCSNALPLKAIEKSLVHKVNKENVLISEPYMCGAMMYFNGFSQSAEFCIDHSSDHLEGIVIFEAARQAGIASLHLSGIPLDGVMIILKAEMNYTSFIEMGKPYVVRTIPVMRQKGGYGYVAYQLQQNNQTCTSGYFSVIVCKNKEAYRRLRNTKVRDKAL